MAKVPQFVRLAPRLKNGIVADVLGSGWSIAGLDVRKSPNKQADPEAYKFVKKALADGRLEGASQVEWDEVHDTEGIEGEALNGRPTPRAVGSQEAHIQREAEAGRRRIEDARASSDAANADDDDDEDDDDEDDDEVEERPRKRSAAKSAKAKKASKKSS